MKFPLLLGIFISYTSFSQIQMDSLRTAQYFRSADSLLYQGNYDSSLALFHQALDGYLTHENHLQAAKCYNKIAEIYWRQSEFNKSYDMAMQVFSLPDSEDDSSKLQIGHAYRNLAIMYSYTNQLDSALEKSQLTLNILESIYGETHLEVARIYRDIGIFYFYQEKYQTALEYYNKALIILLSLYGDLHLDVATTYNNIGIVYDEMGDYARALDYYTRDLKILRKFLDDDHPDIANSYGNLAALCLDLGDQEKGLEYSLKAVQILKKRFGEVNSQLIGIYINIGTGYRESGAYSKSLEYFNSALRLVRKVYGKGHPDEASCYNGIASIYFQMGDFEQAKEHLYEAVEIEKMSTWESDLVTAVTYDQLGDLFSAFQEYDSALYNYTESMKIKKRVLGEHHVYYAISCRALGSAFEGLKNENAALKWYFIGAEVLTENYGSKHSDLSVIYNYIGLFYKRKGEYLTALDYFQKGIESNISLFNDHMPDSLQAPQGPLSKLEFLKSLFYTASSWYSLYESQQDEKYLERSLHYYDSAVFWIDKLRMSHNNYSDKLNLASITADVYEEGLRAALTAYEVFHDPTGMEKAFYFAEKGKAGVLTEAVSEISARDFGQIPDDLIDLERQLKIEIAYYDSEIRIKMSERDHLDSVMISNYRSRLFALNMRLDSLVESFEKNYSGYYDLKYRTGVLSLGEVQKRLEPGGALLEYFQGDSTLYLFLVTQQTVRPITIPIVDSYKETLLKLSNHFKRTEQKVLVTTRFEQFVASAHSMYNILGLDQVMPTLEMEQIDQLIIIPDGSLNYISFETLLDTDDFSEPGNYKHLGYLINNYTISYGYSSTLAFRPQTEKAPDGQLSFAPSYSDPDLDSLKSLSLGKFRSYLKPLGWNQYEVKSLSNITGGKYFLDAEATEARFKKESSKYGILHLAMHAFVDDSDPMNSKLAFTQTQDSIEDGFLHAFELYRMHFGADLAVLSACETGCGQLARGEGIISLARAFAYAGVPNLVTSLWQVSDQPASDLMISFYSELNEGLPYSQALRNAKLRFLKQGDKNTADPYYWSTFIYIGSVNAGKADSQSLLIWIGVIGLTFIIAVFIFRKQRSQKRG